MSFPVISELEQERLASSINRHARRYRIEWRPDTVDGEGLYWSEQYGWCGTPERATIYSETERTQYATSMLPQHGVWVVLSDHNPAGALNVHQLAAIGVAIRETIEAGDPTCDCKPKPRWHFELGNWASKPDTFIAEVSRRLVEKQNEKIRSS